MGIKERLGELNADKQAQKEKLKQDQEELGKRNTDQITARLENDIITKYQEQLPKAIRTQRRLLRDLGAIGVIDMVEEMIMPDKISFPLTPAQRKEDIKKHEKRKSLSRKSGGNLSTINLDLNQIYEQRMNHEWTIEPTYIHESADGSPDPTVNFIIKSKEYFPSSKNVVKVTYSPNRILIIKGAEVTFQGKVNRKNADKDALETAFAQAFFNPQVDKPPVNSVPHHEHPVWRA